MRTQVGRTISTIAVALTLATAVTGHSWLECTDWRDNKCFGWQRGTSSSHEDVAYTYRILNNEDKPACFPGHQDSSKSYTPGFPMASAKPGQTLTFTYLENGHVTKDKLPDKPNPKTYTIHWSKQADTDTIKKMSDLTSANQIGDKHPFDDGVCSEDGKQPGRTRGPCKGSFTVPKDATPGVHQVVWYWKFDKAGPESYTACFDVKVGDGAASPSSNNDTKSDNKSDGGKDSKQPPASSPAPSPEPDSKPASGTPPAAGGSLCGGKPYDASKFTCDDNHLCPAGDKSCGEACYKPGQYQCCPGKTLAPAGGSCSAGKRRRRSIGFFQNSLH